MGDDRLAVLPKTLRKEPLSAAEMQVLLDAMVAGQDVPAGALRGQDLVWP
jgi:hypothetical protein